MKNKRRDTKFMGERYYKEVQLTMEYTVNMCMEKGEARYQIMPRF